jgi:RNA polymerase sigma-70 factor (family 1)
MTASIHLSIENINNKDRNTFRMLYMHYYNILVSYSLQMINAREAAEDIVQELFMSIWEKNVQFKSEESFLAYLYNSIRNASINYLHHKNVEESYVEKMMKDYEPFKGEEMEDELFEPEVFRLLFKVIDELPPRGREIFMMHLDGKKNEEIALLLHISILTVKVHKRRAMVEIKKKFSGFNYFLIIMLLNNVN